MAKISREDLEHLPSDQIREFFLTTKLDDIKIPVIKKYIEGGRENNTAGNRVIRVANILKVIVHDRFINNTL